MNQELSRYIPIVNMIAQTFGRNCEVVLHDLTAPKSSVVYVVNNHVTGRTVGQSFDHLIRKVLLSERFSDDLHANYRITTENGRTMKSSTVLLRDGVGKVIGAICVNLDISAIQACIHSLEEFVRIEPDAAAQPDMDELPGVQEIADDLIDRILSQSNPETMSRREKIDLIGFMNAKGVFLIKGGVEKVAERLGISRVTVYSYLDEVKKQ